MICLIALVVFGCLGIFSAKYRIITKEAFNCVFKKVTLRKCDTGLDQRLKAQITGKLMRKSERAGIFVYKNFEIISWIFTLLMITSMVFSAFSVYNLAVYKNCNGDESASYCIFTPKATHCSDGACLNESCICGQNCNVSTCPDKCSDT